MSVLRISTATLAIVVGAMFALSACAPIIVAGAAAGAALIATDRRSAGAQVDDQAIETKAGARAGAQWGERIHLNVTSYNGIVLLTGEAPNAATRTAIADMVHTIDRVRSVQNEMVVAPPTAMSSRTNDTYITSKVKARFVEENRFPANHVKVVTERQVVYLMGIVTHPEADAATDIASRTTDVVRVVKVFEYAG
ncbi:MAG TPA: BON domain-containing protein [Casimicrobiaceae bacterium]